ncbi:MAG: sulfotransferase [Flavobacteriales bacterium]|nr:sulfotransferase [Flavobacteriales bacterium]
MSTARYHPILDPSRLVFIVGSPRSGTTWLSRMLGDHPQVAALDHELTLFSAYLAPVLSAWSKEAGRLERTQRPFGMPALFSNEEFMSALHEVAAQVYARVQARRPGATLILDKHPAYVRHLSAIAALMPGSRCIHLVRDGRAAISSMLAAPDLMGHSGTSVQAAAQEWAQSTAMAQVHGAGFGPRFRTVRYEELVSGTPGQLAALFAFLGIDNNEALCGSIAANHHREKGLVAQGKGDASVVRRTWRQHFTLIDRYWIDAIAGAQLRHWGYAKEGWWAIASADRLRMALFPLRVRLGESLRALKRIWSSPITRQVRP